MAQLIAKTRGREREFIFMLQSLGPVVEAGSRGWSVSSCGPERVPGAGGFFPEPELAFRSGSRWEDENVGAGLVSTSFQVEGVAFRVPAVDDFDPLA
jgi:hypothetical protein